jgi:P-type Ca2+ transporter type 2C
MNRQIENEPVWHLADVSAVFEGLSSTPDGLTQEEAKRRLQEYGPNQLPEKGPDPFWRIALRQFASPLIYILLAAAIVSLLMGDFKDAGFIAAVLLLNAGIGAYQESQAEKNSHALRKLLRIHAHVQRHGDVREIKAESVVPGDVLLLESGNRIPADVRLFQSQGLEIDESLLTGESVAVAKSSDWKGEASTSLSERQNMAFAGSIVTRGRAKGVVVGTGAHTQVGQLAQDMFASAGGKPPLIQRMEKFTNQIAVITIGASILIGAVGIFVWNYTLVDTFYLIVALAVSAIPEGLPVAMTVALAVATRRMAQRHVIVRRLTAVEGLGSCTLIATDKTGTLTYNELMVREVRLPEGEVFQIDGQGFTPEGEVRQATSQNEGEARRRLESLVIAGVLCNEAELYLAEEKWNWHGDAVDIAMLALGKKLGLDQKLLLQQLPQVTTIPFESERQFAASFNRKNSAVRAHVKGAPEKILQMCTALTEEDRQQFESAALLMAQAGLRVLALAQGEVSSPLSINELPEMPENLQLLGLVGMIDPLKEGVKEAIEDCRDAGVAITMITGDHQVTALAIARELGLANEERCVMNGQTLAAEPAEQWPRLVNEVRVFARVTPRQKLEIVHSARKAGHFVAVTGDGVNDAPALRDANIGVAMGKSGTDVAREAASLVISDDNFSSIVAGIEEGRIAYNNIRNVTLLLVSTGAAELLMVFLAIVCGFPIPLLPVQLLWLNLVTNGIQGVALAFEPGDNEELRRKPRPPDEPIFNRLLIERTAISVLVMALGGFAVYAYALYLGWEVAAARNFLLLTMVLFEIIHIANCRSETKSAFKKVPWSNPVLFFGTLAAFGLHLLAMNWSPLQSILRAQPVSADAWLGASAIALLILPAVEIHKWYVNRNHRA